jgi:LuxR family maltose regulon positive regulatory protein
MSEERSASQLSLAKITRPRYARVLARTRLFRSLDDRSCPLVWLSAPPGAGKTALISSFIEARNVPHLWYQLDRGDGDLPTFFHYLGLAAANTLRFDRKLLPQLRAEFNPDVAVFARRYFETLAARVKTPFVLVFDNYHEVAPSAALHAALRDGIASLPGNFTTVVLSRAAPPPEWARLRVNAQLQLLDWDQLRLDVDEVAELVRMSRGEDAGAVPVQELCERTQGWVGGLVFLLQTRLDDSKHLSRGATHQVLFDYFAGEIFAALDVETQRVLAASALLGEMTARNVCELTGVAGAGELLQSLNQRNYFTLRREHVEPSYEFHPLFREFLLARAAQLFDADELRSLQRKAAALLEAAGHIEETVEVLQAAAESQAVARLITTHAPAFIFEQGRYKVIEAWLRCLPDEMTRTNPRLLYWSGICRLPYDPALARIRLEQAYAQFKACGDVLGQCRAWCAIVDSFVFNWSDFKPLDHWIDEMEQLLRSEQQVPDAALDAHVACGMFLALMYRHPEHVDLPRWEQRVRHIILYDGDTQLRNKVGNHLLLYYSWWMGDLAKAELLVNTLRSQMEESPDPLNQITWQVMATGYFLTFAEARECLGHVDRGLQLARDGGIHIWDMLLAVQGVIATAGLNDPDLSSRYLACMEARLSAGGLMDKATYYYACGVLLAGRGSLMSALENARIAVAMVEEAGARFLASLMRLELGTVLVRTGQRAAGSELIDKSRIEAQAMQSPMLQYLACIAQASLALESPEESQRCIEFLREALAIAARHSWYKFMSWTPTMPRLYALALEHEIETEYVCSVISKRGLAPPAQAASLQSWPWPLRVQTLGAFRILKDGVPLRFTGKSPRKPLELLKAVIAFGGHDVNQSTLIDALWPELEGDNAQRALETALYRLRKLLGDEAAIVLKSGKLTVDATRVWVDAFAIEHLLEQADSQTLAAERDASALDALATRLLGAYRGPFLPEESTAWASSRRDRMINSIIMLLHDIGRRLEAGAAWGGAIRCYRRALEIEPMTQNVWYRLMLCHQQQGEPLEALAVYDRCRKILAGSLGIRPSAEMEQLREALGPRAESEARAIAELPSRRATRGR